MYFHGNFTTFRSEKSPLLNTDKKEFESSVIAEEICSEVNNMAAGSSILNTVILHSLFFSTAHHEKEKT